jgi:hypothetical protein
MSLIKTSELTGFLDRLLKETGRLRTGNNLQYHCPFCHHSKRKLETCLDEPYAWNCWTCGTKGRGYFSLIKKLGGSQSDFSALEEIVGKKAFVDSRPFFEKPLISFAEPVKIVAPAVDLPDGFRSLVYNDKTADYRRAMNYAKKRKISVADIVKYNIGYCCTGDLKHRLVFPSYDKDNRLNFFSTRSYFDDTFLKYINSQVSKDIIGFENLIDFGYPIYLCEGALDAISLRRNAIPLFGKTMSNKLKMTIVESDCPEINIILDDDAIKASIRIAEWVNSIGKQAKIVRLGGKDPNVLGFEKSIIQVKETDNLDFLSRMRIRLET